MARILNLGDARAEQDYAKSKSAFYQSADYRTLIESDTKSIVVGRRGVGKSALFLRLSDYYTDAERVEVVKFAPDEHEILGFRPLAKYFNNEFRLVRAAMRLVFRYALTLQAIEAMSTRYKFKQTSTYSELQRAFEPWKKFSTFPQRARQLLESSMGSADDPESRIAAIADSLRISELDDALSTALSEMKRQVVVLIDRLDEGYEPDEIGIGIVDGFLQGAMDVRDRVPDCRTIVFLRDNIYRAVEHFDQDFSRNLEQSVLRLHWDERALLNFAANRIRLVTDIKAEKSIKVWDAVTSGALQGEAGFHSCLKLTLYRPRDLLLLLNEAFRNAASHDRFAIEPLDVERSAQAISESRLRDLIKEYSAQLPGLGELVAAFGNGQPAFPIDDAEDRVSRVIGRDEYEPAVQQQFAIYASPVDAIRSLYSVGFVGVRDAGSQNYVFCHDGRKPDKDFTATENLMIHPCYWMALNLHRTDVEEAEATQIYDEYDVTVTSETPEQRARTLGRLEAELRDIEPGQSSASEFEQWCVRVIRVLFSGGLRNIELNPNSDNLQRRDIVGTNHGTTLFWKRVLDSYGSRQVLFEVKNFSGMTREEFRQINSYLAQDYGRLGFIISRDDSINLQKERELAWVRELRNQHGKVVILLTAKFLVQLLNKLRSPVKHDAAEEALDKLLDQYIRTYFGEPTPRRRK